MSAQKVATRMRGTVKFVNFGKGFGFLTGEDHVQRFFHAKDCEQRTEFDLLHEGMPVSFTPVAAERGPRAGYLRIVR